jgi:hypothetical protein
MRKQIVTLLLTLSALTVSAQDKDLEGLYRQIDEAIDHFPEYVARHETQISDASRAYRLAHQPADQYAQAFRLYELYRAYKSDSALIYLDKAERAAAAMNRTDLVGSCCALKAFQCSTVGLYHEALELLNTVDKSRLDSAGLTHYYRAQMHVYGEMGYYTQISTMREDYFRQQSSYRDSLFTLVSKDSQDYLMNRVTELKAQNRQQEARKLCDQWLRQVQPDTHDYAIACYYRYLVSEELDDTKYWLAQSALCDVHNAVMDQAALLALSELLNADGDLNRSYQYIRFTWECNNQFNTRMRSWQISPILTVIESNYQKAVERNTKVLTLSIVAVSALALLLLGVLFFLHRRNQQLGAARNALKQSNDELGDANRQLSAQKETLSALNAQLSMVNGQLTESNRVKEEYIGRFMSLCSQYIDKLDNYRKMVNKKMKNKELDELFQLSKSTELKEKELEELYENFDTVFLHLFPNFIDDFNALLQPEIRIHPKQENRLTTDLRIFALIRLGFEDSSKIAEFLHYSVNTIYNYRARIKNGALGNREMFERQVKTL